MSAVGLLIFVSIAAAAAVLAYLLQRWGKRRKIPRDRILKALCVPFYALWVCAGSRHGYHSKRELVDSSVCLFCGALNLGVFIYLAVAVEQFARVP